MSVHCRLLPGWPGAGKARPGDMWFDDEQQEDLLSDQYLNERKLARLPLVVILPNGDEFCVDSCYIRGGVIPPRGQRPGWTVTGEPPNITVYPSINIVGYYHGWLRDGVLSDDCEGRVFPATKVTQ